MSLTWRDVEQVCDCRCHHELLSYDDRERGLHLVWTMMPWSVTPVPMNDPEATASACMLCRTRHAAAVDLIVAEGRTHAKRWTTQPGYRANELFRAWVRGKRAEYKLNERRRKESNG